MKLKLVLILLFFSGVLHAQTKNYLTINSLEKIFLIKEDVVVKEMRKYNYYFRGKDVSTYESHYLFISNNNQKDEIMITFFKKWNGNIGLISLDPPNKQRFEEFKFDIIASDTYQYDADIESFQKKLNKTNIRIRLMADDLADKYSFLIYISYPK